ncbi:MAG: cofactor-independent phosphoglycerate mutase [bacterium]
MNIDRPRYVVIVPDGMGDYPIQELGGKTILQNARIPNMDLLASKGVTGTVQTVPEGFPAGSDVANLSVLGFDPVKYYTGRAPLEAANIGVELEEGDIAYRCNLVTLKDGRMKDFSAGHISTAEAAELIRFLDQKIGADDAGFYPGTSYRHLMVWRGGEVAPVCTPPHDISDQKFIPHLPKGPGSDFLISLMERSQKLLLGHPVNKRRIEVNKPPATSIWLWGQGPRPSLPKFRDRYQLQGGIISAVDLLKGIGRYLDLEVINVPGATGYLDTNYAGKAEYALNALEYLDFILIHIEAPDEAGHIGDFNVKIQAVEDVDRLVVGKIIDGLKKFPNHNIMILPDHYTPVSVKTHTSEPVPFCIFSSYGQHHLKENIDHFDEETAGKSGLSFPDGQKLMAFFLKRDV